jgi:hypothetical protein
MFVVEGRGVRIDWNPGTIATLPDSFNVAEPAREVLKSLRCCSQKTAGIMGKGWLIRSRSAKPKIFSAPAFQEVTSPSRSRLSTARGAALNNARNFSLPRRKNECNDVARGDEQYSGRANRGHGSDNFGRRRKPVDRLPHPENFEEMRDTTTHDEQSEGPEKAQVREVASRATHDEH